MKVVTVLGTRPEIIKLSALLPLLDLEFEHILVHTGQHYDYNMDEVFFEHLKLKRPEYTLNVGSHQQGKQTALMLERFEEVILTEKPDLVIVQGDTNTTLAGALAAVKLHIPVMHVEAGCRSFNRKMPEEINRIIADHVADYLIAPDNKCANHLKDEGIAAEKIMLLGSTAFDAATRNKELIDPSLIKKFCLEKDAFVLVTLHRAENTDNRESLQDIISALNEIAKETTLVFPIHPRTKKIIAKNNLRISKKIKVIEPQDYLSFLALLSASKFCISDSGGIQEEALVFNVPCLMPREETEWMRLVEKGKNFLIGTNPERIISSVRRLLGDEEELQRIKHITVHYETAVSQKIIQLIKSIAVRNGNS